MDFIVVLNSIPFYVYIGVGLVVGLVGFGFFYKPNKKSFKRRKKGDRHEF